MFSDAKIANAFSIFFNILPQESFFWDIFFSYSTGKENFPCCEKKSLAAGKSV